jgi:hypothetical protein
MTTEHFESPPDATLMWKIGSTSLGLAEALAELTANSVDARRYGQPLTVEIKHTRDKISVIDDAQGMTPEILAQALRLGVNMDAVLNRTEPRKGLFGIGMKAAAASLGDRWGISTRHADRPNEEFLFVADKAEYDRHSGATSRVGPPIRAAPWAIALLAPRLSSSGSTNGKSPPRVPSQLTLAALSVLTS